MTGSITKFIRSPMIRIPNNGYRSTGAIFSSASGSFSQIQISPLIMYPAANPATNAPRNPELPFAAIIPPTKPTASAGLSPIAIAINPASTGSMNPNAIPPIFLSIAAIGVIVPKFARSAGASAFISTQSPSIRNASAIRIPPPTTNGSIWDTPFISCV